MHPTKEQTLRTNLFTNMMLRCLSVVEQSRRGFFPQQQMQNKTVVLKQIQQIIDRFGGSQNITDHLGSTR